MVLEFLSIHQFGKNIRKICLSGLLCHSQEAEATDESASPKVSVVVYADTDPRYDATGKDQLYAMSEDAKPFAEFGQLHTGGSFSGGSQVCVDMERKRIYVCENLASRVTALDLQLRKVWQLRDIPCDNIMLDSKEGQLWVSGGDTPQAGETVVVAADGKEIASLPLRAKVTFIFFERICRR